MGGAPRRSGVPPGFRFGCVARSRGRAAPRARQGRSRSRLAPKRGGRDTNGAAQPDGGERPSFLERRSQSDERASDEARRPGTAEAHHRSGLLEGLTLEVAELDEASLTLGQPIERCRDEYLEA